MPRSTVCGYLLEKIILHNNIFPETSYQLFGFAGYEGRSVCPVFIQGLVKDAVPATQIEIDTFMAALGFHKDEKVGSYSNSDIYVWDVLPRNALKDQSGDIFVIDAEFRSKSMHP